MPSSWSGSNATSTHPCCNLFLKKCAFLCVFPSSYSTQHGLQYHVTFCVLQGALRIETGIQFTRWTAIAILVIVILSTHPKESSANKQDLAPSAWVFIIIGVHIQFCTTCFIFVNFVPRLILLYIDSHPPGRFAAICVWLHTIWLMRCSGLLCLCSYTETNVALEIVKAPPNITKLLQLISESSEKQSARSLWSVL